MKTAELMQQLKDTTSKLRHIDQLNYGGCGVAAVAIAKQLQSLGVVGVRIRVLRSMPHPDCYWSYSDYEEEYQECKRYQHNNISGARKNNDIAAECLKGKLVLSHLVVEFVRNKQRYFVDSRGCYKSDQHPAVTSDDNYSCMEAYRGGLTVEEVEKLTTLPYLWNTAYNRRNNRKVRAIVTAHLRG